jgi:hypothetical protein
VIKSWGRAVAIALLVLTLLVAMLLATAWWVLPLDGVTMTVRGETYSLADLHGPRAVVAFCIAVAAVVIALIAAPVMVVVSIGFGALGLAFGLLTAAASLALVVAPFALIGWLLWRLFRERPAPSAGGP